MLPTSSAICRPPSTPNPRATSHFLCDYRQQTVRGDRKKPVKRRSLWELRTAAVDVWPFIGAGAQSRHDYIYMSTRRRPQERALQKRLRDGARAIPLRPVTAFSF